MTMPSSAVGMLERTFVHVQGIGAPTEQRLWRAGCESWRCFLDDPTAHPLPKARLAMTLDVVSRSPAALERGDWRFFRDRLPTRDHWRVLHSFPGRIAYLDIETDGGTEYENVTIIGVSDGTETRQFIRGENLLEFAEALDDVAVLVTFNGSAFDVPVLRNAFPRMKLDQLHIDLCHTLRRLGLGGGLKKIERILGIERSPETSGLSGRDAVTLWRQARWGSQEAMQILLTYNAEDVRNMIPLAQFAYSELEWKAMG